MENTIGFDKIAGQLITVYDNDLPKEVFHGTPHAIWRKSDGKKYEVKGVIYDGDRRGFVVTISARGKYVDLDPGQYRTDSIYLWDEMAHLLQVKNLY